MRVGMRRLEENVRSEVSARDTVDQNMRSSKQSVIQLAARLQQLEQNVSLKTKSASIEIISLGREEPLGYCGKIFTLWRVFLSFQLLY